MTIISFFAIICDVKFGVFGDGILAFLTYLFAILKSVIYGASVYFTSGLTSSADVLDVLALRFLMSAVVLWLLKITRIIKIKVNITSFFKKRERTESLKSLLLAALFEPILYMLFETLGISMSSGITTGVILSLSPISSCICEQVILKEKSTLLQKLFLGIGIIGVIYIAVNTNVSDGKDSVLGILFLVLAVVSGSLFLVFSRKSSKVFSAMEVTYITAVLGAAIFNFINIIRHIYTCDIAEYFMPYFDIDNIIGFIYLAVISTIVATAMNNFSVARAQTSTLAAFGGFSTLTTVVIGALFFDEKIQTFHIIGFTLILIRMIGVSAIAIKKDKGIKKFEG